MHIKITPVLVLAIALGSVPVPGHATLGRDVESTDKDRVQLHARKAVRPGAAWSVHELTLPSGTMVRQYVSPAGRVFAVSWRGSTLPDLRQILGEDHLQTFLSAPPAERTRRRSRMVRQPELVVRSSGRGRFF